MNAETMVLHRFYSERRESELEELLYLAAGVELTEAGLSSSRSTENPDYTLHTRYQHEGDNLIVRYDLFRGTPERRSEEPLAETEVSLRINHYFDLIIASTVSYLLGTAGISGEPSLDARIEGVLPDYPESRSRGLEVVRPHDADSPEKPEDRDANPGPEDRTRKAATVPERSRSGEKSGPGIHSSVGTGALMLLGDITEYFHYGLVGTVSAGMEWLRPDRSLHLGARFNLIRVFKDKQTHGDPLYFTTVGVNLAAGSGSEQSNHFYAGITGGLALISVADSGDTMTKTVPYGEGNIAMRVPLGGRLYLKPDLAVFFIFDDDLLISGVLPSLSAGMEF